MTITDPTTAAAPFELVAVDLYRDIHKGIRTELFAITTEAGQTDPADDVARADVAGHVARVVDLLEQHAEHEDDAVQPLIEVHVPAVAERVVADHAAFDRRTAALGELALEAAFAGPADRRRLLHLLHLDLGSFTAAYLAHQDLEERVVMPALERAIGVDAVLAVHQQIVGSIPPEDMARSLAIMLPAMNLDDRVELLGGMRAGAPAEAFDGVWRLAGSVLDAADHAALGVRLGLA